MWGGRRLESEFQKKLPPQKRIGESWEIVDRVDAQSVVSSGPMRGKALHELWTQHRREVFGEVPENLRFPLLIKILDAQEKLSLQVHPPGNVASRLGGEPKSEFWYVLAADPGAELFIGFREPITRDRFEKGLRNGTVINHIHRIEVQQNSDTTYRAFDWNRIDPTTDTKRHLHVEQAIQCINFEDVQPRLIESKGELLISDSLFEIRKWSLDNAREAAPLGQFAIACCLAGKLSCGSIKLAPGEFFLIPAHSEERHLNPLASDTSLLRVTIPLRRGARADRRG